MIMIRWNLRSFFLHIIFHKLGQFLLAFQHPLVVALVLLAVLGLVALGLVVLVEGEEEVVVVVHIHFDELADEVVVAVVFGPLSDRMHGLPNLLQANFKVQFWLADYYNSIGKPTLFLCIVMLKQ
jgi:hypothetical protein